MEKFINVVNLSFKYSTENSSKYILNNINLDIKKGEFISIIGHNGSGKSTLAKHFNAILTPSSGDVFVKGINTKNESKIFDIRRTIGLILQNPDNQIVSSIVEEDVAFGPENLGLDPKIIRQRVNQALKDVDMYEHKNETTYSLSGGQKQRVAIAGIIAMEPECIVLDEPTAMLDPNGKLEVFNIINKLNKEKNITIVLITHDMNEIVNSDRTVVMSEGKIVKIAPPIEIFSDFDFLNKYNLDMPQVTELSYKLIKNGFNLNKLMLNENDFIKNFVKLFNL